MKELLIILAMFPTAASIGYLFTICPDRIKLVMVLVFFIILVCISVGEHDKGK